MRDVAAYHLRSAAVRLLLAGKDCGAVFSYLPAQPAGRQQAIALVAELVRQGVVTNTGTALHIEQPLDGWLHTIAAAHHVVRLICPLASQPDCCLYPGAEDTTVLCMPYLDHVGQLRILGVPNAALWPLLCEGNPLLELPNFQEDSLPCLPELPTELPTLEAAPAKIPGLLLCMQLYRDGIPKCTAFVMQHEHAVALVATDPTGGRATSSIYSGKALQTLLEQWLKGEMLP